MSLDSLRVALLHCAPTFDNVEENLEMLRRQIHTAAQWQPDLIITPELAVSGYGFAQAIGTDWIHERYALIVADFSKMAEDRQVAIILGTPRYDKKAETLHNSALFIDKTGNIIGFHDKLSVLPGSESWAKSGTSVKPISWRGLSIGLLICADVYSNEPARALMNQGTNLLISPAAWGPGMYEPNGEWEKRSTETGLPMLVCNRTGKDSTMNFDGSASVMVNAGRRILAYEKREPAILLFELSTRTLCPASESFQIVPT